ncbi:MAG: TetR family transcriptional regulator [Gammaproteobacteria bacterium]|jgi:AcrR family transcriptional regulator|nr:TetR family transcriptional regulator [Gammaproteobacteria bacterium]|tara:strand:+ start:258 stop:797 length:540 start_codon:yes stop_codon:yes gene_type:complete
MNKRPDSKARLLDAASAIVAKVGAGHLTIDAVAAEAGMSKGGVLYHFPSKHLLLEGMLNSLLTDFEDRVTRHREQQDGPVIKAWILAEQDQTSNQRSMALALLANAAENPNLLDPARKFVQRTFSDVRSEAEDQDLSTILLLAAEGLRFLDMLDLLPLTDDERGDLHERMLNLAKTGAS